MGTSLVDASMGSNPIQTIFADTSSGYSQVYDIVFCLVGTEMKGILAQPKFAVPVSTKI